jgi:hypothetical protein
MESYRGSHAHVVSACVFAVAQKIQTLEDQPPPRRIPPTTVGLTLVGRIITTHSLPSKHDYGSPPLRFSASYFTDLCTPCLPSPAALHLLSDEYFLFLFIPTLSLPLRHSMCLAPSPFIPFIPLRARRNSITTHDMTSPQRHSISLYCFVYANLPEPLIHTPCII